MNPDAPGKEPRPVEMRRQEGIAPQLVHQAQSGNVPVFSCLVYLAQNTDGGVQARVANLSGIACTAANEREALRKIVAAFKQRVGELIQGEISIPWIDPPAPVEPGEQIRFVPVHL